MPEPTNPPGIGRPRWVRVVWYLGLPLLILANYWLFPRIADIDYFQWYLSNGVVISLAAGFLGLVWEDMEERKGLLSADPVRYMAACFTVAGVLTFAMGTHLKSSKSDEPIGTTALVSMGEAWDKLVTTLLAVIVLVLTLAWCLLVAPLGYVTTLVAGAPARMYLRGDRGRSYIRKVGGNWEVDEFFRNQAAPVDTSAGRGVDVSISRKPFALTQAISAVVLFLAKTLLL